MAVRVRSGPRPYRKAEILDPGNDSNWKIRPRGPWMRVRVWEKVMPTSMMTVLSVLFTRRR